MNARVLCFLFVLNNAWIIVNGNTLDERDADRSDTIMVFGGNGMLGSATVERLLQRGYSLVLVNRGNWYWDTESTVRPYVRHLKCDRMQSLQRCAGLQHYIWSEHAPRQFEAVIDFSAYHSFEIHETLKLLTGRIKLYVYISSDSVYEVCDKRHEGFTREEDAVRPRDREAREQKSATDDYGNRKLECEEALAAQAAAGGVPYVALRLPDVIGPRDNTYRWWIYQLWVKLGRHLDTPLSVNRKLWNQPLSFVYGDDVADVIVQVLTLGDTVYNQAFNLALNENPTLVDFLHNVMDALDVDDVEIQADETNQSLQLFPSVRLGPVDTSKAKQMLNWNPTSWIDVVDATVAFYENATINKAFENARNDVMRTIQQHLTRDPMLVLNGLQREYNLTFGTVHEEL